MYMKFLVHKMGFMMQEELTGAAHFQLHKTLTRRQNVTINELTKLMFITHRMEILSITMMHKQYLIDVYNDQVHNVNLLPTI